NRDAPLRKRHGALAPRLRRARLRPTTPIRRRVSCPDGRGRWPRWSPPASALSTTPAAPSRRRLLTPTRAGATFLDLCPPRERLPTRRVRLRGHAPRLTTNTAKASGHFGGQMVDILALKVSERQF